MTCELNNTPEIDAIFSFLLVTAGAVMLSVELQLNIEELLQDIEIYKPKNPKHFWMGVSCRDPHITIHHGFELTQYEELAKASGQDGKTMFTEDIQEILRYG